MAGNRDAWSSSKLYGHRDRRVGKLTSKATVMTQYINGAKYSTPANSLCYSGSYKRTIDQVNVYHKLLRQGVITNSGVGIWFDMGGPFWSEDVKLSVPQDCPKGARWPATGPNYRTLQGRDFPHIDAWTASIQHSDKSLTVAGNVGMDYGTLLGHGTTGISRAIPSLPSVSLFQILGELREGLPGIPGRSAFKKKHGAKRSAKANPKGFNPGDEFLNVAFGIMPSAQSILDLVEVANNYDVLRDKLVARYGKRIRRKRTVLETSDRTYTSGKGNSYPCIIPGDVSTETITTRKVWVDSTFSQAAAVSAVDAKIREISQMSSVVGLAPNVANIWELVPWSWLIDWFSNAGEVFKNLSYCGVNGLRLLQAYVMCETHTTTTWTWYGVHPAYGGTVQLQQTLDVTVKQRLRASPYILGLTFSELSPFQKAVLASLGWSRVLR